MINAIER